MARIFAVIRTRGAIWNDALPMERHDLWEPHRAFMNALEADGFVRLGGPLEGSREVLLIFRAESEEEIETRLAEDPWTRNGFLRTTRISPWQMRIG
ncbi:MAG TPA: YciI family protein, partial [Acetobacteraceae bacterium]|nr:YciI family protein [Acetobacteraceae bacterium]